MSSPATGEVLLHYRIVSKVGQGGMGDVYRAEDLKLGRPVAIKLLKTSAMADEKARLRLLREARSVSALNHANIVTIHAIEESEGRHFIVMELLDGQDLRSRITKGPLAVEEIAEIGSQAAAALEVAHGARIIHRDIKPGNIIVTSSGSVKVLDFGLAKGMEHGDDLTSAGTIVGTLAYMSPEQLRGSAVDHRTDIYSLGCVLYEACTGRQPFESSSLPELVTKVMSADPEPTGTPLDPIISRALAKDPDLRYESAAHLRVALRDLGLGATVTHAAIPSAVTQADPRPRSTIVGRERELQQLESLLSEAVRGSGRVVFVTGEAGIGKSSAVEEFLRRAAPSHLSLLVGRGHCVEQYGTGEAYLPFLEAVSNLLSGPAASRVRAALRSAAPTWCLQMPAVFGSEVRELQQETIGATKDRMMREMGDALAIEAGRTPVILILEDLHWADTASVDLLRHLRQRMEGLRLMIVATLRPSDLEVHKHPLRTYRLEMQSHAVCKEVSFSELTAEDVAGYLDLRFSPNSFPAELASTIHAKTEGLPLFLSSLVQLLADRGDLVLTSGTWQLARPLPELDLRVPPSVMSMIRKQLEALGEQDIQLLQCAAIQGHDFLSTIIASSLSLTDLAVEERLEQILKTHGLVRFVGEEELPDGAYAVRYRFTHALYHNALYEDTLGRRRVMLHKQAGEALERHHGSKALRIAGQLAMHFERARQFDNAVDHLLRAGDVAVGRYAHAEAVDYFTRALELAAKTADAEKRRLTILHKRALSYGGLGRWQDSEIDAGLMLEEARALGDGPSQVLALAQISMCLFWTHQLQRMRTVLVEARRIAAPLGNGNLLIDVEVTESMCLHAMGDLHGAIAVLEGCLERAEKLQYKAGLGFGQTYRGSICSWQGDYVRAEKIFRECIPATLEARNPIALLQSQFMLGLALVNQGRISEGLAVLAENKERFERNGVPYQISRVCNTMGWCYREMGDFARAAQLDQTGIDFGAKYKAREGELSSWINLAREFTRTGQYEKARETFRSIEEMAARDDWHRWLFLGIRYQAMAAEHYVIEGDLPSADKHLRILRENATGLDIRKYASISARLTGQIAAAEGDLATAEGELLAGIELLRDRPAPLAAWKTWSKLGSVRRRRNDSQGAREAYGNSAAIIDAIAKNIAETDLRAKFLAMPEVLEVRSALD